MEITSKYLATLKGFNEGSASWNFPLNVLAKIGLVRTHSIHTPYTKTEKSSGLTEWPKNKKPDSFMKSSFFGAGERTRTADRLITNHEDSSNTHQICTFSPYYIQIYIQIWICYVYHKNTKIKILSGRLF